jgi:hypothetical protein
LVLDLVVVVVVLDLMVVVVVVVFEFERFVQQLVELCEQRQRMKIQEDLVEVEWEQDERIEFLVEDNHKHELELVPMMQQMINVQDTIEDRLVYHIELMEH